MKNILSVFVFALLILPVSSVYASDLYVYGVGNFGTTSTTTIKGDGLTSSFSGSVAIGATSTTRLLEVAGSTYIHGGRTVFGTGTNLDLGSDAYMYVTAGSGYNAGFTANRDDLTKYASFDLLNSGSGATGWSIQMKPSNNDLQIVDRVAGGAGTVMYFKSGGNIGIGASSPATLLDIFSTATTTVTIDSNHASRGACLKLKDSDGSGYTYVTANNGTLSAGTVPCN